MGISSDNFKYIQSLAKDSAAIVLEPGKEYLVESRLAAIAAQAGFPTLDDFLRKLRLDPAGTPFHDQIVDALTTNETSFFRDHFPFETLRTHILPQVIQRREATRRISIWSAASSTGQEAYSIAMILREHFPQLASWNVTVLGTDYSPTVVKHASVGAYSQLEVSRGLPAAMLVKYFTRENSKWLIKDEVKRLVEFKQLNLIKPWPSLPQFDVIFIRNVMIYFDVSTKRQLLQKMANYLQPGGFLFLGTAETTLNLDPQWKPVTVGKATFFQTISCSGVTALPLAA